MRLFLGLVYLFGLVLSFWFIELCSKNTEWADFRLFWGVGQALMAGKSALVYPSLSAFSFDQTIFNDGVPFLYPPNFAAFSVLFSPLPMETSYALTRIFLGSILVVSGLLYFKSLKGEDGVVAPSLLYLFLPPLLFFPVAESIGIGQLSIFLYLFPVIGSVVFVLGKRYFLAGLILGLVFLKPQPMPGLLWVFITITISSWDDKLKWRRFFAGLGLMGLLNLALTLCFFGFQGILGWLHGVNVWMSAYVWGSLDYYEPYWLIASVPMVLGRLIREFYPEIFNPILPQCISLSVYVLEALVIFILSKSKSLTMRQKLEAATSFVVFSLPVAAPYMRVYDLAVFVAPFWFVFFGSLKSLPGGRLLSIACILLITIIDLHLILVPQQMANKFEHGNFLVASVCVLVWLSSMFLCLKNSHMFSGNGKNKSVT